MLSTAPVRSPVKGGTTTVEIAIFTLKEGLEDKALSILNDLQDMKAAQPGYVRAFVKMGTERRQEYLVYTEFDSVENLEAMRNQARAYLERFPLHPYLEKEPFYGRFG